MKHVRCPQATAFTKEERAPMRWRLVMNDDLWQFGVFLATMTTQEITLGHLVV